MSSPAGTAPDDSRFTRGTVRYLSKRERIALTENDVFC